MRSRAMWHREHSWAEFWSGVGAIAWAGVGYATPAHRANQQALELVDRLFTPPQQVVIAITCGAFQLVALLADVRHTRGTAAVLASLFYGFLFWAELLAAPWTRGLALYAGFVGMNFFAMVRAFTEDRR